jgi:hypothetical protein
MSRQITIEIYFASADAKICDALCLLPPGGGKCGDPTLSNRKSAVLMAPRFLLLGKNSVKPCKYRPFGGRL